MENKVYCLNKLEEEVLDYVLDKLDDFGETRVYSSDLVFELLSDENQEGYIHGYCNDYDSRDWGLKYFWQINTVLETTDSEVADFIKKKFWDDPKGFQVCIYIEVAQHLLGRLSIFWDGEYSEEFFLDEDSKKVIHKAIRNEYEYSKE